MKKTKRQAKAEDVEAKRVEWRTFLARRMKFLNSLPTPFMEKLVKLANGEMTVFEDEKNYTGRPVYLKVERPYRDPRDWLPQR
jgi:hypothetical protein